MKYCEEDRESLHRLLDKMIDEGEECGIWRRVDTPILGPEETTMTTMRLSLHKKVEKF